MLQAVIFDMDGLLIDSERVTFEELAKLIEETGGTLPKSFYVTLLGRSDVDAGNRMQERYGEGIDAKAMFAMSHVRMAERYQKEGVPVKPGAEALLRQLNADGVPCVVASSSERAWVLDLLGRAGLAQYFQGFVCGDEVMRAKPDPEIFLNACKKVSAAPENALVLEDAETGIRAAHTAGIPVICIPDLKQPAREISAKTYDILPSLEDVRQLLKEKHYAL